MAAMHDPLAEDLYERFKREIRDQAATWEERFDGGPGDVVSVSDAASVLARVVREDRERFVRAVADDDLRAQLTEIIASGSPIVRAHDEMVDEALAAVGARIGQLEAEVARLRAGEAAEPATMAVTLTPAEFLRKMNDATPERRLELAARVLDITAKDSACFAMDHEARLEDAERAEREGRRAMLTLVKAAGGHIRIPERILLETDFDTEVLTRWDDLMTGEVICEARGGENEAVHKARVDAANEAFLKGRRPLPPAPALGASCDAGQCDTPSTGWRWYAEAGRWLPVCIPHGREDLPNYVPDTAMVERIHPGDDGGTDD